MNIPEQLMETLLCWLRFQEKGDRLEDTHHMAIRKQENVPESFTGKVQSSSDGEKS
ncbi:hypothetical cytosolic protein [Syntrophus aciditrophicus SB]|uniref:Hypothetical cytosolic protein n=1 Tax=Syntrophus aciditrophicus (strain SB) TaxID=56780 RepID=Q2LU84_SYNAS|nr:hypothetical cytosolic protein [Syntrophus aciditrophicus SB]